MYRFAVLPYVNVAPLVHFIPQIYPNAKLTYLKPCNTTLELISGKVDAAVIPIVDYFNTPALEMVKGLGICANGNVESVLLQCKYPLKDVRTIKLDPASRTSNLLLKVLIKQHFNIDLDVTFISGDYVKPDAEVVIGDRALLASEAYESYDLAGQWKDMTGLPFVFAVWAYRTGHPDCQKLTQILHVAKQAGCDDIGNLSKLGAEKLGISETRCCHYLTDCLHYDIGADEQAAMDLFRQLSMDLKNIQNKPIKAITTQNLKESTNAQTQRQRM